MWSTTTSRCATRSCERCARQASRLGLRVVGRILVASSAGPSRLHADRRAHAGAVGSRSPGRAWRQGLALPVVFLTGHATVSASVRAMKAGAVDFLAKPVKREVLLDALKRALARDAQRRTGRDDADRLRAGFATLSAREREVFDGVAAGKSTSRSPTSSASPSAPSRCIVRAQ